MKMMSDPFNQIKKWRKKLGGCGEDVRILDGVIITEPEHVYLGNDVTLFFCSILQWYIKIGDHSHIGCFSQLYGHEGISIGKGCAVAPNVVIHTHSTVPAPRNIRNLDLPSMRGEVIIGNDVLIGTNTVIFPNVKISDGAVIGACSLILEDTVIPPYEKWIGQPVRKIGERT